MRLTKHTRDTHLTTGYLPASRSSTNITTDLQPLSIPNYSFVRPRSPSLYMRTILLYFDAVNARDYTALASVFDDKQYIEYWKGVMALFAKFETKIHEVIEAGDKLTVHASSLGKSWSGTPYSNEYVLMVHFAPSLRPSHSPTTSVELPKIRYLKEFVDSSVSLDFFREESERRKKVHGVGSPPPRLRLNSRGLTG
ncbi:hypothetical protein BKA70DRAFT_1424835 [Coprinopsis sp. MPI-PUGE-AT-0042]|nr:hypothetical protein BKA70DRAFT_1424835 [Coprinopsis sp. MPI-PUGE-AT-0042]